MPSFSATSTSVFGRFAGRKQTSEHSTASDELSPPIEQPPESDKSKATNGHKRESSILSLTSDIGHNVKRSVSLRSHRGSGTFGHKPRFPSSGNILPSSFATAPIEDEETESTHSHPSDAPAPPRSRGKLSISAKSLSSFATSPVEDEETESVHSHPSEAPAPPRSRGKLSISARGLSSKFKSSDNLLTLATIEQVDTSTERPTTAVDTSKSSNSSMLSAPAPAVPKRAPPEKPNLQTQSSFARDATPSHAPNGVPLQPIGVAAIGAPGLNPHLTFQQIHETSAKRMATIEYLRKVHDGNIFYFGTLHYTPNALHTIPSLHPLKMGRRANNYLILGYSLPTIHDLHSNTVMEYLRALSSLLQEFETYQTLSGVDSSGNSISKGRMGAMFKSGMGLGARSGKGRRASTTADSISISTPSPDFLGLPKSATDASSPQDIPSPINAIGHDFQHLVTPHLPFDADFNTTYATLCDTLIDTYGKLIDLVHSPEACVPGVGEAFTKADKAIRKILVSNVMREFEDSTRANVKSEVAGLGKLVFSGLV